MTSHQTQVLHTKLMCVTKRTKMSLYGAPCEDLAYTLPTQTALQ